MVQIRNNDPSALLAVQAGAGASIIGEPTGWLYIGPTQSITVISDGANYTVIAKPVRTRLAANSTLYVGTAGNDNNNGLTPATAWRNPQKAWNVISASFDLNTFVLTTQVADGAYSAVGGSVLSMSGFVTGQKYASSLVFKGNTGSASGCTFTNSGGTYPVINVFGGAQVTVQGFQITSSNGQAISVSSAGTVCQYGYINFGSCGQYHVVTNSTSLTLMINDCNIIGAALAHWDLQNASTFAPVVGTKISMSSAAFSVAFCAVTAGANWSEDGPNAITFIGSATGPKYQASLNGGINTQGSGVNYFPGSVAGSVSGGGFYN
jgi:hypothetical protein